MTECIYAVIFCARLILSFAGEWWDTCVGWMQSLLEKAALWVTINATVIILCSLGRSIVRPEQCRPHFRGSPQDDKSREWIRGGKMRPNRSTLPPLFYTIGTNTFGTRKRELFCVCSFVSFSHHFFHTTFMFNPLENAKTSRPMHKH